MNVRIVSRNRTAVTLEVAGHRVISRSQRRYIVVAVRPEPFHTESGTADREDGCLFYIDVPDVELPPAIHVGAGVHEYLLPRAVAEQKIAYCVVA